jgi:hypothetical protein
MTSIEDLELNKWYWLLINDDDELEDALPALYAQEGIFLLGGLGDTDTMGVDAKLVHKISSPISPPVF